MSTGLFASFKKLNLNLSSFEDILFENAIVAITDVEGIIIYANNKFCELLKYSEDELLGQNHGILKSDEHPDEHPDEFFTDMWNTISSGKIWYGEIKNRAKDDSFYWLKTSIVPL